MIRSRVRNWVAEAGIPAPSRILSDFRSRLPLLLLVLVPGALALLVAAALSAGARVPFSTLTRDSIEILQAPPYYGALSNLGVLAWWSGAVACFIGGALVAQRSRNGVGFLVALGSLTALLVLDDLLLLHDVILPRVLGIRQRYVLVGYVVLAGLFLVRFRKEIFRSEYPLMAAGLGLFFLSVLSDVVQTRIALPAHHAIEDGCKMLGILAWTAYAARLSTQRVLAVYERRQERPAAAKAPAEARPLWGTDQQPGTIERRHRVGKTALQDRSP